MCIMKKTSDSPTERFCEIAQVWFNMYVISILILNIVLARFDLATRPCIHLAFQNQDQDQAQEKLFSFGLFLKPTIII